MSIDPCLKKNSSKSLVCISVLCIIGVLSANTARLPGYFTTHWSDSAGGCYNEGYGRDADTTWLNYEKDGKPWDTSLKPSYNNYHCMVTSPVEMKISPAFPDKICFKFSNDSITQVDSSNGVPDILDRVDKAVNSYVRSASEGVNKDVHVDFINFGQQPYPDCGLISGSHNFQVLINVRPGSSDSRYNSLYTIIFPPVWKRSDKLPMRVISTGYGSTSTMTEAFDSVLICAMAELKLKDMPYICILTNHGGHESLGINSKMMNEVAMFLSSIMPGFGGDPNRVSFEGGSRGGTVALSWGADIGSMPYRAQVIYAKYPATKIGDMFGYSLSVFPDQNAITMPLGSKNAWQFDYCHLTSEQKARYVRQVYTGCQDRDSANMQSPYGFLNSVNAANFDSTCIIVTEGTHDGFMPMPGFLQLDSMMTARKILHVAQYGFGAGHDFTGNGAACGSAFQAMCQNQPVQRANGREYYMVDYATNNTIPFTQQLLDTMKIRSVASTQMISDMPFSVTIPYRVLINDTLYILLMGKNGCSWSVSCREETGYNNLINVSGIFGKPFVSNGIIKDHRNGSEFQVLKTQIPSWAPGKRYEWSFYYNGCEIPNRFTPKKYAQVQNGELIFRKAVTEIIGAETSPADYQLNDFRGNTCQLYNFGIDQLHPLLLAENAQPLLGSIANLTVNAGDTARFNVTGRDPDQMDTLVYDVRFADSGNTIPGATFNGKTGGAFIWPTSKIDSGKIFNVVASARDGKGGKVERKFTITVGISGTKVITSLYIKSDKENLNPGDSCKLVCYALDQFNQAIETVCTWSVSGGGKIDQNGLFKSSGEEGIYKVTARSVDDTSKSAVFNLQVVKTVSLPAGFIKTFVVLTDENGSRYLPASDTQYIENNGKLNSSRIYPGARVRIGQKEYVWTTFRNDSANWFDSSVSSDFVSYCFLPIFADSDVKTALELWFQLQVKIWVNDSLLKVINSGAKENAQYSPAFSLVKGTTNVFLRLGAKSGANYLRARFVNTARDDLVGLKTKSLVEPDSSIIHVMSPDSGGKFNVGDTITVRWSAVMPRIDGVNVNLSIDNGKTWDTLTEKAILPTDKFWGVFKWCVPNDYKGKSIVSKDCLIRVSCNNLPCFDNSDQTFTLGNVAAEKSLIRKIKVLQVLEDNRFINVMIPEKKTCSIDIYGLNGVVIYRLHNSADMIRIDKGKLSSGVYFMRISSQSVNLSRKIHVY